MAVEFSYKAKQTIDENHPLVSVVMTSYNQPEPALKSLRSVMAQDYDNIELVVCDDVSTDGTYEAVLEACMEYARSGHARFSIIVNRNEENLGVTKNYESGFILSHGELLITQGGDDIAHPGRVSAIVDAWIRGGRSAKVIFHGLTPVGMDDSPLGYEWWPLTLRNPLGAVMSYSPDVVRLFPRIDGRVAFEDGVFTRRAALLADPLYLDEKLLDYRVGSGVTSCGRLRDIRIRITEGMVASARQTLKDIGYARANGLAGEDRMAPVEAIAQEMITTYSCENRMITAPSFRLRFKAYRTYVTYRKTRMRKRDFYGLTTYYIPLLLPKLGPLSIALHDFALRHGLTER